MNDNKILKPNNNQDLANGIDKDSVSGSFSLNSILNNSERNCPYCGNEVAVGDYHCHKCGAEYEQE
ncbi:MAG: hypothetical protein JSV74_01300 [Dehalococcoidia bacterium]|nr:MAG: hypothetical protein JSV74_01300 [Dehalococcoidia bacterium]